jgi:lysophospholipase L1-like esterase
MPQDLTRRAFVSAAAAGAVGLALRPGAAAAEEPRQAPPAGGVILFQGDSITDVGRKRDAAEANNGSALGGGYPFLLASAILRDNPTLGLSIYNRGISGNKVPDLKARWEADAIALKPDVLSILIGVNDIWHKLDGNFSGTVQSYETDYTELLRSTRAALPQTRIIVMEPFVLRTGSVNERWFPEFDERRAVAKRVAKQAGATFVPLQDMFTDLARGSTPDYWLGDGVHPTLAGHQAITERWRKVVGI